MVGYTFKSSFVRPIQAREKRQTIRLPRRRQTRVGDKLQFFTGPRFQPIKIGGAVCEAFHIVRLDFSLHSITIDDAIELTDFAELDAFAIRDGFRPGPALVERGVTPWEFMALWWRMTHPELPIFRGEMVDWGETFTEPAVEDVTVP